MNRNQEAYSQRSAIMFQRMFAFVSELGHGFVGSEHILWSLTQEEDSPASELLSRFGFSDELVKETIERFDHDAAEEGGVHLMQFSGDAERVIEIAEEKASEKKDKKIEPEHLLLGILLEEKSAAASLITSMGADLEEMRAELGNLMGQDKSGLPAKRILRKKSAPSKTLERFSKDLTAAASAEGFDPMIGRAKEIRRLVQILSRRTKNNPVLVGEPGVGKTAIIEGLAQHIVDGRVPENLADKRILSLDLTAMLSGTRFRGDFEERIKGYLEEAQAAENVILFLDELHNLIGAGGGEGAMDAANIFKPILARGELQVIGATTFDEYRKHIEKDTALERRFQQVTVDEPTSAETERILLGLRDRYETFHGLTISDDAIKASVELSERYIQDRFLPDKAIDLMDEAASRVRTRGMSLPPHLVDMDKKIQDLQLKKQNAARMQDYEKAAELRDKQSDLKEKLEKKQAEWTKEQGSHVDTEDIAAVISSWTNIPVTMITEDESKRLLKMEELLHERVIGQDEAITAVSKAVRRSRVGINEPGKPIGSFLFLGPTGVGKTELSRALAEVLFQDEEATIRLDMSEFMEQHTVSKMIGSPPGYVGYDEGGQLTEKVRRKPYSIILLDEIEKAHPDVWNLLLQIMDDGRLTDAQGRTVSFKNTVLIMTSNIGAREILGKSSLGFVPTAEKTETRPIEEVKDKVMDELKKTFRPEFLNRLDETIVFHQLERQHIRTICRNLLDDLAERTLKKGVTLQIEEDVIDILVEEGFDPAYGARPLRRTIQSMIENAVAEKILEGNLSDGDKITVKSENGEILLNAERNKRIERPVTV